MISMQIYRKTDITIHVYNNQQKKKEITSMYAGPKKIVKEIMLINKNKNN